MNAIRFAASFPHPATVLSRAAGPSRAERRDVDPPKGPVLLNYGIEECRFLKPVYPGSTCHPGLDPGQVKFTCREKLDQEKRPKTADSPKGAEVARGIVKWLVDVVDETGETVALATILTMVKKLDQANGLLLIA
jgi:oxepin-CoA hydrolase/3-oxo-5,6-dehydrosuberyl-CoA semialdehyde dehydrogenase